MGGRPSLSGRLRLLVGAVALVLVGVMALLGLAVASFRDDMNGREDLIPAGVDVAALSALVGDQLGAGAEPSARQEALVLIGRLDGELTGHPDLLAELAAVRTGLLVSQTTGTGTRLVASTDRLASSIAEATSRAADVAERSRQQLLRAIALAAGTAVALLVAGTVALRRWFVLPVRSLADDVGRIAEGEHDLALRSDGSRELAQLADSVARMRDRILSEHERVVRATEAVDQQAPAAAALRTLLEPRLAPAPPGLTIAGGLLPTEGELAGDWYDISERDGTAVLTVGDVCGHGVDAGVLAVRTKFALLDAVTLGMDPAAALQLAADRFGRDDTFVTVLVVEVDPVAGRCRYASAGHHPGLVFRPDGTTERLTRTGPLIGLAHGPRPNAEVAIGSGDVLVLYTDGVVEARGSDKVQLHADGLELLVREAILEGAEPDRIVELVMASVTARCGGRNPDDATLAVVRVDGG